MLTAIVVAAALIAGISTAWSPCTYAMAETFTPDGCGSRRSQWIGLVIFTVTAITVAAGVGALAGWIGSVLPGGRPALVIAAALIGASALREAGVLRFPIPVIRRQVPEAWRRTLPLPLWTSGYGVILGVGFGTYQLVATYWAVVITALAVGDPMIGAIALGVFGLTRGVMAASPVSAFDLLSRRGQTALRSANAIILALLALALVPAIADAQTGLPTPVGGADPTVSDDTSAFTWYAEGGVPSVRIVPPDSPRVFISDVREPALSGGSIAVVTVQGIEVRDWRTGQVIASVGGQLVHPALSGDRLAYVELLRNGSRLVLRDLRTGTVRVITRVGRGIDLGRASISGQAIVWHQASGLNSRILMRRVTGGPVQNLFTTRRRWQVKSPSLAAGVLVWIENDAEDYWVRARRLSGGRTFTIARSNREVAVTTATDGRRAWIGMWRVFAGTGRIQVVRLPAALVRP